jgi:hypothetical protein
MTSELRAMKSLHGQLAEKYGESWAEDQIAILVRLKSSIIKLRPMEVRR